MNPLDALTHHHQETHPMPQSLGRSHGALWRLVRPAALVSSAHGLALAAVAALACIFGQPATSAAACAAIAGSITADCTYDKHPHWMADNANVIGQRPLSQVVLPGSHDSATAFVNPLFGSLAQVQSLTVGEQLDNGVRMFDLRFCDRSGSFVDVVACHGAVQSTESVDDIVQQIANFTFASGNDKEILYLNYNWYGTADAFQQRAHACDAFMSRFYGILIPNNLQRGADTSLNEFWSDSSKRRIIAKFGGGVCAADFSNNPLHKVYDWSTESVGHLLIQPASGTDSPFADAVIAAMTGDLNTYRGWPKSQPPSGWADNVTWKLQGLSSLTHDASVYLGAKNAGNATLSWLETQWNEPANGIRGVFSTIDGDYVQVTNMVGRAIGMNQSAQGPTIREPQAWLASGGPFLASGSWANGPVQVQFDCNPGFTPPAGWSSSTQTTLTLTFDDANRPMSSDSNGKNPAYWPSADLIIGDDGAHVVWAYCDNPLYLRAWSFFNFNIDSKPPTITASATNADGTAYAAGTSTSQPVTVHFTCADQAGLSGVASCPQDQVFTTAGTFTASGRATDKAGNSASASFGPIQVVATTPVSVSVSGSYVSGMPRALFTYATNPAGVALMGTLSCTHVGEPNKYNLAIDAHLNL
ncbi:MAG TPA: hypothetical protein VGL99_01005, partial [Chloroflexota bacterium]